MMTGFNAEAADQIFWVSNGGKPAPVSFDTAAADESLAADTQAMLTLNAHEAAGKSPDQVAHAARLSRSTGAPIGAVMADMPWFEAMDIEKRFRSAPEATRAFLTNPVNAALAKDDIPNLSALNRAWDKLSSEFNAGIATNKLGFLGHEAMGSGLTPERQERINAFRGQIDAAGKSDAGMWIINNMAGPAARMVGQQIEGAPRRAVAALTGAGAAIIAGQMGPQALIPEELVTAPVAAILGWRAQSAIESGQIEQGMAWLELNDIRGENGEPLDPTVKTGIATGVGLINGALEMVGEGAVAKPVIDIVKKRLAQGLIKYVTTKRGQSAFKNFTKAYGLAVAGETGTEVLQEITNITAEEVAKMASDGSFDRLATSEAEQEQAIDRIIDIATRTAGGMALLGIPGASIGAYSSSRTAAKAKTSEAALADAVSAVRESKLAARDPESMAAFIRQVTEDGSLHVSAQSLSELYQSGAIDQATLDALGVTEQLPEAIAAGGDLRIAPDKYLIAVARMTPDARSQMISNTRIEADGMTAAEAEAFLSDTLAQNRDAGDPSKLKGRDAPHREFDAQEEIMRGGDPFLDPVYDEHVRREIGLLAEGVARDGAKGAELERVVYGRVLPGQIEILEKHGLSREKLAAAPRIIHADGVGHALKKHGGDPIPLQVEDIANVPDVVRTGELIDVQPTDRNLPGLIWRKNIHGSWLYVVEELTGEARQGLFFKTAYRTSAPKTKGWPSGQPSGARVTGSMLDPEPAAYVRGEGDGSAFTK